MGSPALVAAVFNLSAPGANTGILASIASVGAHAPTHNGWLDVYVALAVAGVLNMTCTAGGTTHKWGLNESTNLAAADKYHFRVAAPAKDHAGNSCVYDLEIESDGVVEALFVYEVHSL